MPTPRHKTSKRRINQAPLGVAERLGDAPVGKYVWRKSDRVTYSVDGVLHHFDGTCHATCQDVR